MPKGTESSTTLPLLLSDKPIAVADTPLLRLSAEFEVHWAAEQAAIAAIDALPKASSKAENDICFAALSLHQTRMHKVAAEIHEITPSTTTGIAIKAQVLRKQIEDFGTENSELEIKHSYRFLRDVLGFYGDYPFSQQAPPEKPDAEFIKMCDAQIAAHRAWLNDPKERDTHDHPEWPEYMRLDPIIRGYTPTTFEGITALARVVNMTIHDEPPESPFDVQIHRLVTLMADLGAPAHPVRDPDVEIKSLAGEYEQIGRDIQSRWAAREGIHWTAAEEDAFEVEIAPLKAREEELSACLAECPAKTLSGVMAKVRGLVAVEPAAAEVGGEALRYISDDVNRAVIRDLLALGAPA